MSARILLRPFCEDEPVEALLVERPDIGVVVEVAGELYGPEAEWWPPSALTYGDEETMGRVEAELVEETAEGRRLYRAWRARCWDEWAASGAAPAWVIEAAREVCAASRARG